MTVLVTGAGGFVGGAIASELAKRGHEVTALARNQPTNLSSAHFVQQDLQDTFGTLHVLADVRCDAIVHAAARMAGVSRNARQADYAVNEEITKNLFSAVSGHPPSFVLCISSIDVYAPTDGLIDEGAPIGPETDYAVSKFATEQYCQAWANSRSVSLGIARLTQVFGPGDRTGKIIPNALAAIKARRSLKLFGDGEDRRDYLFIKDAARLVAKWTERRVAATLNLATGVSRSINEVVEHIRAIDPTGFRVERYPRQKPKRDCQFDTKQLIKALGPVKFTPFPTALNTTYEMLP